jgi:hypothetical protein
MTPTQYRALDMVADRLGQLYQKLGRLQHRHAIDDPVAVEIMDEIVRLTGFVERVSNRVSRTKDQLSNQI